MDIFKHFKTDKQAELDGTWVPVSSTCRLKIARAGNPRHQAAMKRLLVPYVKPGMRTQDVPDETFHQVAKEAASETILLNWEGVLENGEVLPYSKENVLRAFEMEEFYRVVWEAANTFETFRVARLAELEKN